MMVFIFSNFFSLRVSVREDIGTTMRRFLLVHIYFEQTYDSSIIWVMLKSSFLQP